MNQTAPRDHYWLKKWETGETQFHQQAVHPQLLKHFPTTSSEKVMVPLCGKSLDLLWLKNQGHEVIGIELSPIACEAFFKENHLEFQIIKHNEFTIYQGQKISLWCGDFFQVPISAWNQITVVYDRAALIALPPDLRKQYAELISKRLQNNSKTKGSMLLITVEYPDENIQGPPFSVPENEVRSLYENENIFHIDLLETQRDSALSGRAPKFEHVDVKENVYRLIRNSNL